MLVFEYANAICIAAVITPAVTFLCQTMDLPVPAADLVPEVFRKSKYRYARRLDKHTLFPEH